MDVGSRPDERSLLEFDRLGYHVERGAFEPDLLDALEDALVRHERAGEAELPVGCPRSWTPVINECRLMNLLECGGPFERLIDHRAHLGWMRALVGEPLRLTAANSITRARGIGLPLHSVETAIYRSLPAGPRCDQVTAAVWLSDCGPGDGPMVVFEGTHRTGERPACRDYHPAWKDPGHDRAMSALYAAQPGPDTPWEDLPGYRELCVRRGDLVVFAESIWHGAREVRSERVRRSLYLSYSPFHCANWHGLAWSEALKARVGPERRALLEGPFIGTRYPGHVPPGVPDRAEFPLLRDSELGPREFPSPRDSVPPAQRIERELARAVARSQVDPGELAGLRGACELRLAGAPACTLAVADGRLALGPVNGCAPDALIQAELGDLAGLFRGELQAVELFESGRVRVLGDLRLAMRVASFLFA